MSTLATADSDRSQAEQTGLWTAAADAVALIGSPARPTLPFLLQLARKAPAQGADIEWSQRNAAVRALAAIGLPELEARRTFEAALRDPDAGVRDSAALALLGMDAMPNRTTALLEIISRSSTALDGQRRLEALEILTRERLGTNAPAVLKAIQAAAEASRDDDPAFAFAAADFLNAHRPRSLADAAAPVGGRWELLTNRIGDPLRVLSRLEIDTGAGDPRVAATSEHCTPSRRSLEWAVRDVTTRGGALGFTLESPSARYHVRVLPHREPSQLLVELSSGATRSNRRLYGTLLRAAAY
jgi:hypothetical protein